MSTMNWLVGLQTIVTCPVALCLIFTIWVSFSHDNALFASKAKINVFFYAGRYKSVVGPVSAFFYMRVFHSFNHSYFSYEWWTYLASKYISFEICLTGKVHFIHTELKLSYSFSPIWFNPGHAWRRSIYVSATIIQYHL